MRLAIQTDRLTKHFGRIPALTDLSIEVPHGSIFGFLGPNGAGKTTAMRILAGLTQPSSGSAWVNGIAVTPAGHHRRALGFLAQDPRFYGWMTGRQVLRYVGGFYGDKDPKRIEALLERVGIADAADRKTKGYSGGMRQRLGIAQALIGRPSVIILDEPVSALDPIGRSEVLELMRELKGETTVFYSTHILDDVQKLSDYVAILDKGRLITAKPTKELLAAQTKGQVRVTLVGTDGSILENLARLPGVTSAKSAGADKERLHFDLIVSENALPTVQRAVTRLAAERSAGVLHCDEIRMDLENVFLKLIGAK